MTLTAPLSLLALLAVPAVVALHLFRNRLPQRSVAALFLFPPQALQAGAGRTRTRLFRSPSFWCEVAAAIVLALWLAGLSFGGAAARPLVVVLDDSASMGAAMTRGRALQHVHELLAEHGSGGFVGILRSGERPEILLDPRGASPDAMAALARWQPARPRHDLGLSLDLARELAGDDGEVVFVTDEAVPARFADVTVLACGVAEPNCALLGVERVAAATTGAAGAGLRVRAAAYGAAAATEAAVFAGEREVARATLTFVEGLAQVVLPLPTEGELRVELTPDALAVDNTMWRLPEPERIVAVADRLPQERRQSLGIDRVLAALSGWRSVGELGEAQVILAAAPGPLHAGQTELVFPRGAGKQVAYRGPFVIDRSSPWVDGLQLQGVIWVATGGDSPGRVLVAAGQQALLSAETLDDGRRLWLRLEGSPGNVVRSPDWPVLFANLFDQARAFVPGPLAVHVPVGGEARYQCSVGPAVVAVVTPAGERRALDRGLTVGFVPEQPGIHRWLGEGERELARIAAHFVDASESDLRQVRSERRAGQRTPGAERRAPVRDTDRERQWLAGLLLLLLVADWWVLQRRAA